MKKALSATAIALALLGAPQTADAQARTEVGTLIAICRPLSVRYPAPGGGWRAASSPPPEQKLRRHPHPLRPRRRRDGHRRAVLARSARTRAIGRGALAGNYFGVSVDASLGAGAGAKVLVGGSRRSTVLQPIAWVGNLGVNLAAGITGLTLRRGR